MIDNIYYSSETGRWTARTVDPFAFNFMSANNIKVTRNGKVAIA
jgi:hypothetical protein